MTFKKLQKIFRDNNIPENVVLMSDSGWECCATDMDGIYYNKKENVIVFTQRISSKYSNWLCLYPKDKN